MWLSYCTEYVISQNNILRDYYQAVKDHKVDKEHVEATAEKQK